MTRKSSPMARWGNGEVLTAALKEVHREFLRFLASRTARIEDAEDVLQDFYLKVIQGTGMIRNPGSLRGWLAQVLRRTLVDHYRKAGVRQRAQQRLLIEKEPMMTIDDGAERAVCGCMYRILPVLPGNYAEIIWRVDLLGHPRPRVAKSLGISANSLAVRIHRARRSLREALVRFCVTCPTHGFLNCACEAAAERPTNRNRTPPGPAETVMRPARNRLKKRRRSTGSARIRR
jgi:RNA polymerase sigma factor (sigma-70 family)